MQLMKEKDLSQNRFQIRIAAQRPCRQRGSYDFSFVLKSFKSRRSKMIQFRYKL